MGMNGSGHGWGSMGGNGRDDVGRGRDGTV